MRHKKFRDIFAKIMHDVCYYVEVEPTLQLLQGKSFIHKTTRTNENSQLDIKVNGLFGSRSFHRRENLQPTWQVMPDKLRRSEEVL